MKTLRSPLTLRDHELVFGLVRIVRSLHARSYSIVLVFTMKFINWNCNGASSKSFLMTLKDLVNRPKPMLIIGLLETKCSGDHADTVCNSLGFAHWCRVEALGLSGGIWLLWKEDIDILILKTHPLFFHVKVSESTNPTWLLSVVDRSSNHCLYKFLWRDLNQGDLNRGVIGEGVPWIVVGDFNSIGSSDETSTPSSFNSRRSTGLNNCMYDHGLFDLGYFGPKFMWARGNSSQTFKGSRLDRALCNTECSCFPHARVEVLPKLHSDHSPLLTNLAGSLVLMSPPLLGYSVSKWHGSHTQGSKALSMITGKNPTPSWKTTKIWPSSFNSGTETTLGILKRERRGSGPGLQGPIRPSTTRATITRALAA